MKPARATLSKVLLTRLPPHIRHVQGSTASHLLVLPGLLTSAHESTKITRLMEEAKTRGWSALSLDYFSCFSNHGHIWSGTHQSVPNPSVSEISWARWQNDILDALRLVAWLPQQQETQESHQPGHSLTIVGCSAGFALALQVLRDHSQSLACRFGSDIHLAGVGASPDPRPRWRKEGVVDPSGHWIWVPSPYAKDSRGYPLPIGLVDGKTRVDPDRVPQHQGQTGIHSPERLRVTLIHGDADEVIPLERAMDELPAAVAAACGVDSLQERHCPHLVDVSWRVIRNGDHRLSRESELGIVVAGVFTQRLEVGKLG